MKSNDNQDLNISISNYKKFKIVFLGDQNVGKSCVISRYVYDSFDEGSNATIGVDFVVKSVYHHGNTYKIHFWDTAGQERFHSLIPSYIKDCQIAVLVYDVSNRKTFENIDKWISKIKDERGDDINLGLMANKIDVLNREVTTEEGMAKAASLNAVFQECSAKSGLNVSKYFEMIIENLVKQSEELAENEENIDKDKNIILQKPIQNNGQRTKWCC